ncbi:PIG-P-domain-containing protein [Coprinopsis sp. MPI-PUGE-AT-0042]|nr:PIG-P-domain-containing protein [Coprinopsis sp. MPI-PUGE-AT-0042]
MAVESTPCGSDDDLKAPPPLTAAPWPPPEHRSRAPEFYGFVAWTTTYILFVVYILWAVLPDEWIVWLGVTWYPNREWAILVPAWTVMAVLFTYFTYSTLALAGTPALDEMRSIADGYTLHPNPSEERQVYLESMKPRAVPELYDLPIGLVNRVLYQKSPRREQPIHQTKDKHL